jgi:hypothetical protein
VAFPENISHTLENKTFLLQEQALEMWSTVRINKNTSMQLCRVGYRKKKGVHMERERENVTQKTPWFWMVITFF